MNRGISQLKVGDKQAAGESFKRVLELDSKQSEALLGLASICVEEGRTEEARAHYAALVELKGDSAEILFNAALLEQQSKNHEQAAKLYSDVIERNPNLAEAHLNLAVALQSLGDQDKAIRSFEQAIRLKPQRQGIFFRPAGASQGAETLELTPGLAPILFTNASCDLIWAKTTVHFAGA